MDLSIAYAFLSQRPRTRVMRRPTSPSRSRSRSLSRSRERPATVAGLRTVPDDENSRLGTIRSVVIDQLPPLQKKLLRGECTFKTVKPLSESTRWAPLYTGSEQHASSPVTAATRALSPEAPKVQYTRTLLSEARLGEGPAYDQLRRSVRMRIHDDVSEFHKAHLTEKWVESMAYRADHRLLDTRKRPPPVNWNQMTTLMIHNHQFC